MMLLLTREHVMAECLILAQHKVAGVLKVPLSAVTASWEMDDGKIKPKFEVDAIAAEGLTEDEIKTVVSSVYRFVKSDLSERLAGLTRRRHGQEKDT